MSASLAAIPVGAPFKKSAFESHNPQSWSNAEYSRRRRVGHVKYVLKLAGLTVSQASELTAIRYGRGTPYYVPPTFLYKIRRGITPHVCQLVALSQLTDCRFADWMNLCGFDLRLILPLQLEVHTERTAMITPALKVSPREFACMEASSRISRSDRYYFVKIGSDDNVVYPKLLPGSVVRADRYYSAPVWSCARSDELLWLVEHPGGLACCHIKRIDSEHIVLLPSRSPLSAWPLRLSSEARILGLIDLELRPRRSEPFEATYKGMKSEKVATIPGDDQKASLSTLLRSSRARAGLTLRAAQHKTVRIAQLLQNPEYRIPLGLLSDYEATDRFPRHIAKIITLCVIYGIDFWQMMKAGGSSIDDAGKRTLFTSDPTTSNNFEFDSYRGNLSRG